MLYHFIAVLLLRFVGNSLYTLSLDLPFASVDMDYSNDELHAIGRNVKSFGLKLDSSTLDSICQSGILRHDINLPKLIPLVSERTRRLKHHMQAGTNANNLVSVPLVPSNCTVKSKKPLSIGLINCQSICNKCDEVADVVRDTDLDALVITETWLTGTDSDQKVIGDLTVEGYSFCHSPRTHRRGGGIGFLYRDSLKIKRLPRFQAKSFENYQMTVMSSGTSLRIAIIYRLHPTKKNGIKTGDFFREFSEFVDTLATNNGHLLILGDFNIHWDSHSNADTKNLSDILQSANLTQHVTERTHKHGHILDLVISRDDDNLINEVSVSSMLSDHFLVNIDVSLQKPSVPTKTMSYRKYRSIDKDAFANDLRASHLIIDPPNDLDQLVDLYNNTLIDLIDKHAPLKSKEMPIRSLVPWFNKDIQAAKRHRRCCERLFIMRCLRLLGCLSENFLQLRNHSTTTIKFRIVMVI